MRVVVDAMGGDNAPDVLIEGAVQAIEHSKEPLQIILTGDERLIKSKLNKKVGGLEIVHTTDVVSSDESITSALKQKKNSSIAVGIKLQREGKADAFISAGNTAAVMTFSLFTLDRLKGVLRPSIAAFFPTLRGYIIVIDVGANTDCKPLNLLQFAVMGSIYVEYVLDRKNPKIGLLNIGEEPSKGDELTQEAYKLLSKSNMNFIGNVEGQDVLTGEADVIVCDGFTGNVILKFTESLRNLLLDYLRIYSRKKPRVKMGISLLTPFLDDFKNKLNYEEYGGAPLLGVNGISIVCHGKSSPTAIRNAIFVANRCAAQKIHKKIEKELRATS